MGLPQISMYMLESLLYSLSSLKYIKSSSLIISYDTKVAYCYGHHKCHIAQVMVPSLLESKHNQVQTKKESLSENNKNVGLDFRIRDLIYF